jgi:hypothetical protein
MNGTLAEPCLRKHFASVAQIAQSVSDERVNKGVVGEAHFSQTDGSAVVPHAMDKTTAEPSAWETERGNDGTIDGPTDAV